MATVTAFPSPDLTGIPYSRYFAHRPDYEGVTYKHTFEDKGVSTNTVSATPIRTWELEWRGLTPTQAKIWDDHHDLAFGIHHNFSFTDKEGNLHTNVRYVDYEPSHDGHKSWIQHRKIKIAKYP